MLPSTDRLESRRLPDLLRHLVAVPLIGALLLSAVATAVTASPTAAHGPVVDRQAGLDRYATAAAISADSFEPGRPVAYVATGLTFPDALAGAVAAARHGAPLLLVRQSAIPAETAAELRRLKPGRIVVLGGQAVVSDAVREALGAYTVGDVTRISGPDRYATAAAISKATFSGGAATVYVATGRNFPDALAAAPAATRAAGPLLLVDTNAVPAATATELNRLKPQRIFVVGGASVVSNGVLDALRGHAGSVSRIAGANRYETAAAISRASFDANAPTVYLATGGNFPDALAGAAVAGRDGVPILLTATSSLPAATVTELKRLNPTKVVLLGGPGSVSHSVAVATSLNLGGSALPACTYQDVLTKYRAYSDWHRSLLDTIYMLPSTYHPGDMVDTSAAGLNSGHQIRSLVVSPLSTMAADARKAGAAFEVQSAFRSYASQQATFNHWVSVVGYNQALAISARPGHSEHQLGTTLDFRSAGGGAPWEHADWATTKAGAWLKNNAWKYGFVLSYHSGARGVTCYDYEPWHYRYVGHKAAAKIHFWNITPRQWMWLQRYGN
jgi:putative cell wall-binding protein